MKVKLDKGVLQQCILEYDGKVNTVPVLARKYSLNREALYQALWRRKISHRPTTTYATRRFKDWLCNAKSRALAAGIEWSLTYEDVHIPETCPLLGIPIRWSVRSKVDSIDSSPSLDRIDPTKGYTKDNVWVVSYRANRFKSDASLEELKSLVTALEAKVLDCRVKEARIVLETPQATISP